MDTLQNEVGGLQIFATTRQGYFPVEGATVSIALSEAPSTILQSGITNSSGQTKIFEVSTPNVSLSLDPDNTLKPYTDYTVTIQKEGFEPITISGSEVLPGEQSILPVEMIETTSQDENEIINIPPHTLYGDYPPKIPEAMIKPIEDTGEIVLSRVVIPEYIVVHDGAPSNSSAKNYYVPYTDYIKNVVSSEIYATWPESAIYANTLAIMSFTLNRVYTEWYRNQGYNFTITSSTAYDQKWIYGRNIYKNIDQIVDSIFANYLSKPGLIQPLFAAYCDGSNVSCSGLSQWGSKTLASRGYSAIEIIRYYYGNDVYINSSEYISGIPASYPGYNLTTGSSGTKVRQLQQQLNRIARNYPLIPTISVDGKYGSQTARSVRIFQNIFGLPQTGITDFATWYAISRIYVAVARLSEFAR